MKLDSLLWVVFALFLGCFHCACNAQKPEGPCHCNMTAEEMAKFCPITALGDSIVVCKTGTIRVAGLRESASWTEYMRSEYFGGEGKLVYCKSGKAVFNPTFDKILNYNEGAIQVDLRQEFDVYDPINMQWVEKIALPVYRKIIFARNDCIQISTDSLIFKPPFQNEEGIKRAIIAYEEQKARSPQYLTAGVIRKLFAASINGDEEATAIFLRLSSEYADFLKQKTWLREQLSDKEAILRQYNQYLEAGGEKSYFDLKIFPYFEHPERYKRKP